MVKVRHESQADTSTNGIGLQCDNNLTSWKDLIAKKITSCWVDSIKNHPVWFRPGVGEWEDFSTFINI